MHLCKSLFNISSILLCHLFSHFLCLSLYVVAVASSGSNSSIPVLFQGSDRCSVCRIFTQPANDEMFCGCLVVRCVDVGCTGPVAVTVSGEELTNSL